MNRQELAEALAAPIFAHNKRPTELYTLEEARGLSEECRSINIVVTAVGIEPEAVFFPSNYCFQSKLLPGRWVHCATSVNYSVVPRPGFEDGRVKNLDDMLRLHHSGAIILESIEELLDYCGVTE